MTLLSKALRALHTLPKGAVAMSTVTSKDAYGPLATADIYQIVEETSQVLRLRLKIPADQSFSFTPGQWVSVAENEPHIPYKNEQHQYDRIDMLKLIGCWSHIL